MRQRPFKQVDVFTDRPYLGNPLAVVLDGEGLGTEEMQHFTNWTNLSEATFLLPPTEEGRAAGADYRVRIFCPGRELPFAGHPTLGSCHAWLEAGGQPRTPGRVVQECGIGQVTLRQGEGRLAFAAPPLIKSGPLPEGDVELIARGLGIDRTDIVGHAWCDNGPNWRGVMLSSAEAVLAVRPDAAVLGTLDIGVVGPRGKVGVVGGHGSPGDDGVAFEVRAFFPGSNGLAEDPVTGSLNAALAQWLIGAHLAPPRYIASQGTALGRAGRVHVEQDAGTIWVGGGSVTCVDGQVLL
ncbi:PhzF family phenazine biosynthesis protein [Acidovorax sp. GBBC 3334]|uniref:PhzF family phenazine biosynthesis protein n=1 Tax=Acidovorax sp. GBBC 3334 TaxID=2940496 RepID=UPI002302117C|nr:PhzF family phenazine biosynthesis protein [Acidovorax sp. GBBC 3334]MDA8455957.1 PhzF family phenazine biosynthesis protein [Acidovorax sp. GBBC 3334]